MADEKSVDLGDGRVAFTTSGGIACAAWPDPDGHRQEQFDTLENAEAFLRNYLIPARGFVTPVLIRKPEGLML